MTRMNVFLVTTLLSIKFLRINKLITRKKMALMIQHILPTYSIWHWSWVQLASLFRTIQQLWKTGAKKKKNLSTISASSVHEIPFWHVLILHRFNTVISLAKLMSEVMLIWINMWAVPYLVPLQVIFTQNSIKKQKELRKLLLKIA